MQISSFPSVSRSLGSPAPSFGGQSSGLMMMQQMMALMMTFMSGMMAGQGGGVSLPSASGFGSQAGASSGIGGFLGGSNGGGSSAGIGSGTPSASTASSVDVSNMKGTEFGKSLAQDAGKNANGPGGLCFKWVSNALRRHGVNTSGASAYMAADQLAKNPKFKETQVSPNDFKKLPPGAVVVWDRGKGHEHGHISLALGDGREASDKIRNQITNYGTKARVFIPK